MTRSLRQFNRVGILGGGQLSLMLADAVTRLGYQPLVLAENSFSPAALRHPGAIFGTLNDEQALQCLFSQVKCVVFENEFVDCEHLRKISAGAGVQFFPDLGVIEKLQDKLNQKRILEELGIPNAEYVTLDLENDYRSQLQSLLHKWEGACILKWAKMGYDGKGVLFIEADEKSLAEVEGFISKARRMKSSVYAERKVRFKKELAMIGVYSVKGEFQSYPLVISEQKKGICYRVFGPAKLFGTDQKLEKLAGSYVSQIARSVGLFGSFGVEFFETESGELCVNEIAPRVHNSGHYSQDASFTDQFENHWRAILGMKLGPVQATAPFGMLNILGPDFLPQKDVSGIFPEPGPQTHVHWYGKSEVRPGRKLGHLNGTVTDAHRIEDLFHEMESSYGEWIGRLK